MLINCHTHTLRSHDSSADPSDICREAVASGLGGVVLSDHCDCEFSESTDYNQLFVYAMQDFLSVKREFKDKLQLFFGIELGDPLYAPAFADRIIKDHSFDAVLLSIHAVRMPGFEAPFSRIDFRFADESFIVSYLEQYFDDMLSSVLRFDFDILCHLTVPLRYLILNYKKQVDLSLYADQIDRILKELITRDKCLEINTSALAFPGGFLMPDENIIDRYISLGGTHLSIGSDAHTPKHITEGFDKALKLLRKKNIKSLCCYKNRQRLEYDID